MAASILRVDGDTGAYSGTYVDGKWLLIHFDGSRPGVIVVALNPDGTLQIQQHVRRPEQSSGTTSGAGAQTAYGAEAVPDGRYADTFTAYREEVAKARGLAEPENYETHTTARDPKEKFAFRFPDVDGQLVSNEDPRFKGKVVLAIVTGTWCPNCHDEAQYLVQLDRKYRDKGLAIVALDFEEPEQQGSLERERAFVKKYGVKYTYLIAGAPSDMWEKVRAARQSEYMARHHIYRTGRARPRGSFWLCLSRQWRIQCETQAGIYNAHRAAAKGETRAEHCGGESTARRALMRLSPRRSGAGPA